MKRESKKRNIKLLLRDKGGRLFAFSEIKRDKKGNWYIMCTTWPADRRPKVSYHAPFRLSKKSQYHFRIKGSILSKSPVKPIEEIDGCFPTTGSSIMFRELEKLPRAKIKKEDQIVVINLATVQLSELSQIQYHWYFLKPEDFPNLLKYPCIRNFSSGEASHPIGLYLFTEQNPWVILKVFSADEDNPIWTKGLKSP